MPDITELYRALASDPRLQKNWEANQPRLDRALEAPLIAREKRAVATAALLVLKLNFEPAAKVHLAVEPDADLIRSAKGEGSGGVRLANILEAKTSADAVARAAAIHTLQFYRDRSSPNPLVRLPWTAQGLGKLAEASLDTVINPALKPTSAALKAESVTRLAPLLSSADKYSDFSDEALRSLLRGIPGLGPERADAVGVFGFRRGWPITDEYLWRLLERHKLLTVEEAGLKTYKKRRIAFEPRWQSLLKARLAEPPELAATLYLWADEAERWMHAYVL